MRYSEVVTSPRGESEGYTGGAFDLSTSANSTFVRKLIALARDAQPTFAGDGDLLPLDAQASLCDSDFFRGVDGAGLSLAEVDEAYALAHPMHATGIVPVGCLRGCIIGGGVLETIARMYGVTRTLTPSSWRGRGASPPDLAQRPASLPSDAEWQPGLAVTNRIKVNYGGFINRLLGLDEPLRLYPGKVFAGASYFTPGEDALVVDYDGRDHEFSGFRDELRGYPGFYVGKMFALPGASLWDGALTVPRGRTRRSPSTSRSSPPGAEVATPPARECAVRPDSGKPKPRTAPRENQTPPFVDETRRYSRR